MFRLVVSIVIDRETMHTDALLISLRSAHCASVVHDEKSIILDERAEFIICCLLVCGYAAHIV